MNTLETAQERYQRILKQLNDNLSPWSEWMTEMADFYMTYEPESEEDLGIGCYEIVPK